MDTTVDTLVVGGGQTGLIVGHALRERGVDHTIVDANPRVGDAWRNRWDSLRLFTQAFMNGLPGMDFPGPKNEFVTKDQIADYLERYADEMNLDIRSGVRVERLTRDGETFVAETTAGEVRARSAIVAMADYQRPRVPPFASTLDPGVLQMHSSEYENPSRLQEGPVLVVGLGNSGADIALDVAEAGRETIVAGKEKGAIPFRLEGWFGRNLGTRLVRFAMVKILNTSTPMGRRVRRNDPHPPLVRVRPKELKRAGVRRVGRIVGTEDGLPVTDDGTVLDVANVIWCTGFRPGFDWIDLPIFDEKGRPVHERGVVDSEPGLYFVGLFFLHAFWSETVTGVQPDVKYVVDHLMKHHLSDSIGAT